MSNNCNRNYPNSLIKWGLIKPASTEGKFCGDRWVAAGARAQLLLGGPVDASFPVTLPVAVAHRHRVWGGPHLQAGEMHILYDAARAGHDLLLQEQAAQLQRRQPDLPVCGAHGGQPHTPRAARL